MRCFQLSIMLAALVILNSCSGGDEEGDRYEFPDPVEEVLLDLPEQWNMEQGLMTGFPDGIEIYKNESLFQGKSLLAYAVVFDPKKAEVEFRPALGSSAKTPTQWYNESDGTVYAVMNGGFFGPGVSYSLVQYQDEILANNILSLTRPYNNENTTYYPTRAAFGLTADNIPKVSWVYHVDNVVYGYPTPSPNQLNKEPQPQPSATFPEGGEKWGTKSSIGGSPNLLEDGEVNITEGQELIVIDNGSSRARSAIGHTGDGIIIMLAVEGNNDSGGVGLNLTELAQLLKEMGVTDAINLDGGGSTSLVVNGKTTVKPSPDSGERAVMSAIFLEKK